jgi:deazaflavin-dependent oxidoreductase (nitroreductase family)
MGTLCRRERQVVILSAICARRARATRRHRIGSQCSFDLAATHKQPHLRATICDRIPMATNPTLPVFRESTPVEKLFNRTFGFLVGLGIGPAHIHLLEVRGRKSGKLYRTPVDLLKLNGKQYLVAPRGQTQWVRNAAAAAEIVLKRGSTRQQFCLRAIPDAEKPPILKAYLDSFKTEVQRYFTVVAGSPPEAFARVASYYPAFELLTK